MASIFFFFFHTEQLALSLSAMGGYFMLTERPKRGGVRRKKTEEDIQRASLKGLEKFVQKEKE